MVDSLGSFVITVSPATLLLPPDPYHGLVYLKAVFSVNL